MIQGLSRLLTDAAEAERFSIARRQTVIGLLASTGGLWFDAALAQPQDFEKILAELASNPEITAPMRRHDELEGNVPGLERAPIRSPKSSVPISQKATELIIACEVSSRAVYEKLYRAPAWPRGKSGLTIGIGYDIGYVTETELKTDWEPYLPMNSIEKLSRACRITGTAAATFVKDLSDITIDWATAEQQFQEQAQPRYVGMARAAIPKVEQLDGSTLGSLVSLVYNRGASFSSAGDRYVEMRNIKEHLASGYLRKIPNELRSMKRLWEGMSDMRGVVLRREAEALLFESGLSQKA